MKAFLILALLTAQGINYEKIEIKDFTNCDTAFENKATWYDNPNFTEGNGQVWGFYIYNNNSLRNYKYKL